MPRWRVITFVLSLHAVLGNRMEAEGELADLMVWCARASMRSFPLA